MSATSTPTPLPCDNVAEPSRPSIGRKVIVLGDSTGKPGLETTKLPENVSLARSFTDLIAMIGQGERPLVLLGAGHMETAKALRDLPSRPLLGVLADEERPGQSVHVARALGLGCVFNVELLRRRSELDRIADWMERGGPPFGLAPHLEIGSEIRKHPIKTKEDKPAVISQVLEFVTPRRPDPSFLFEFRLILEESINNAIFHAFRDAGGREKYSIEKFERLEPGEEIELLFGADSRFFAVAVTDNQGRLKRDKILERVERQLNARGLLDQNGRGIHLVYSLSERLIFNLCPQKMTQVVILFPLTAVSPNRTSPVRPLMIFSHA